MGYITAADLARLARAMGSSAYGQYLLPHARAGGLTCAFVPTRSARRRRHRARRLPRRAAASSSRPTTPRSIAARHRRPVRAGQSLALGRAARCAACTCRCGGRRASWCASSRARSSTSPSTSGAARRRSASGSASRCRPTNFRQCYVPPGFAHGFCVLSAVAQVEYKCTDLYDPASEIGIAWNDPALGIAWPVERPMLSERDTAPSCRSPPSCDRLPVFAPTESVSRADKVVGRAARRSRANPPYFLKISQARPCDKCRQVAGLITAGRRECWGSQTSESRGASQYAVPFCFVHCRAVDRGSISTRTSANLRRRIRRSAPDDAAC